MDIDLEVILTVSTASASNLLIGRLSCLTTDVNYCLNSMIKCQPMSMNESPIRIQKVTGQLYEMFLWRLFIEHVI